MTLEAQLLARACGKTNIHSLEPEDLAALTMEASALAKVPLSGTNHTVGVATQDPKLRARLNPDDAALRVYNYLHSMTLEAQLLARACGKTNIHSLEPEDLAALTSEASALAKVPFAGTNYTVGVDNYHKI